jgi:hypothetical protein
MNQQLPIYQLPIAVTLLLLGAALVGYTLWCLVVSFRSRSWPEVAATVVSARVVENRDEGTRYEFQMSYRYSIDGREFTSSRVRIGGQILSGSPGSPNKQMSAYPPGKKIRVHYCPTNPSLSVLEPGPHFPDLLLLVLESVIVTNAWNLLTGAVILK